MRCVSCSSEINRDTRYCASCGTAVCERGDAPTRTSLPRDAEPAPSHRPQAVSFGAAGVISSEGSVESRWLPGTLLAGRYRVVGLIGRGGMGEVCRADDLKLNQPVALKFLPQGLADDPDRLQRFLNEVRIARQISHPNVCRVYDIGEIEGQHFISMEFVDGEDLASLLRRIGRLPADKAVQIGRQICAGLAAAHDRGILHRDLKPANVMLDGRGHVRITDFGLAGTPEQFSQAELRAGTPEYMAPEQLEGREVSERSDVYSLGLVLYELFTGTRPFRADSLAEVVRLQREATPTGPSTLVAGIDASVERVILRCLDKDPQARPSSALAVSAALPGGDPLAEALAAGETPSPELVAAAGPEGGLQPAIAVACLLLVLLGIPSIVPLVRQATLHGRIPVERPAALLRGDAQRIVAETGYADPPVDRADGFAIRTSALRYLVRQDSSSARWDSLGDASQAAVYYSYRQSPEPLSPNNFNGTVRIDDPPPIPGNLHLALAPDGRLQLFQAVPPAVDHDGSSRAPTDWARLFSLAGLALEDFEPAEPTLQPQVHSDTRRAWAGHQPGSASAPLRVEAASLEGRPVFFKVVQPYDPQWSPEQAEQAAPAVADGGGQRTILVLLVLVTCGAVFLAQRNWRQGRGDRRGALRLALYVLSLRMLHWLISGHHVTDLNEQFGQTVIALSGALLLGTFVWILYMGLEPYFRRLRPQALVSWTRLLAGQLRDPLVGRDVLIGFAFCIGFIGYVCLSQLVPTWLGLPPGIPLIWAVDTLEGGRQALGKVFQAQLVGLAAPLGWATLYLLLRIVLRGHRRAATVFVLLIVALSALQGMGLAGGQPSAAMFAVAAVGGLLEAAILLTLMLRFGVLSMVSCFVMTNLLVQFPLTLDIDSPHFATALLGMLIAAGATVFAFYVSLAGRPLFQDAILQQQA